MFVLAQEQGGGQQNFLLPNFTIVIEVLLFLLILYILKRYVWPPLSKAMNDRQEMIRKQVEDSEEASRKRKEAEERYESALADARTEAAKIRDTARADGERIREELRTQAQQEADRIRQRGEDQLASQHAQAERQLRGELGGLSVQLAEKLVGESLADDSRRRATIDRFLGELDGLSGQDGPTPAGSASTAASAGGGS